VISKRSNISYSKKYVYIYLSIKYLNFFTASQRRKGRKGITYTAMALLRKHCKAMLSTIEMERGAVKRSE
jgi:hypothetical protein